ncbi:WAT1-related protein [Tripterygium wilfordii]|uniref:WAT1-related protein n=1 Tax=Tripterygium wilfordii TaxID=458696 RepID=A0A7J7BUN6_TRIWF|nr:WAT1-related protein At5g07050-like [Tripterygium wilfordii]KAF5725548.1 WAT1-related protein [Tripterygium wilfordii]
MQNQEENVRGGARMEPKSSCIPYFLTIVSCLCVAGFIAVAKVALNRGMSHYILVVYGNAIGTLATALFASLFERNNKNKITGLILRDIFFLGLLGSVLGRILYYAGLEYTSVTLTAAMSNLGPSATFILALICRMEKVDIFKRGSQAKVGGTIIALAGATLVTFYHGPVVISPLKPLSNKINSPRTIRGGDWIKGCLMLLVANVSISGYYVLQTIAIKKYPAPLTLTSLTCLAGTILSAITTVILDRKASTWRLTWDISLLAPIYSGIIVFGISNYVQTLVMKEKGPVFMTAFIPLGNIITAIIGLLVFGDALHTGDMVGAILIIIGLYATLWGKANEQQQQKLLEHKTTAQDVESKLDEEDNHK